MLSESQEVKLDVLREFSIADIKEKLVKAFQAIKDFILNLITKIKVFFKNIGKEKYFKKVGDALAKMSPEERAKKVRYWFADFGKIGTKSLKTTKIGASQKLAQKILKADEAELKDLKNKKPEDYMIIPDGLSLEEALEQLGGDKEFSFTAKNADKMTAYKDITKMSGQLDKVSSYFDKLGKSFTKDADNFKKVANTIKDDKPDQAQLLKNLAVPVLKGNSKILSKLAKEVTKYNKKLMSETLKLVKGKDSAMSISSSDFSELHQGTTDFGESYNPWAGLE
jgi:site-specific DNA-adenine methylase